jgi:UDPglucose--hexose-1-phosphate uridylyltransferase
VRRIGRAGILATLAHVRVRSRPFHDKKPLHARARVKTPHRRYNPLLDEWVLVSPQRLQRPWQGLEEPPRDDAPPPYDPTCYLCPGNPRAQGQRNPPYAKTFAFDNDFPALFEQPPAPEQVDGLRRRLVESGTCRVICFTPRHDLTLATMPVADVRDVVDAWAEEVRALEARPGIGYVQLFENKGELMGCSNPHPHCQVWATTHVPTLPARKLESQRAYFAAHGRDLLGDYLAQEETSDERVIYENAHWAVLVPFWAVWPFETMLVPRRHVNDLPSLTPDERDALAEALHALTVRYDNLFRTSFPYSMGWHGRPALGDHPSWRLHAVFLPPLLRSAVVRKFLVGYELAAEPQRDLTPEEAAERLRTQPGRHYLEATQGA